MQEIRGFIIKTNRKRLGYSLEALSHGICSPSYLSKVENNETKASDEIYSLLFKKMKIEYSDSKEVERIRDKIDFFFENFFSFHTECKDLCIDLLKDEKYIRNTNVFLYFQIFKLYTQDIIPLNTTSELDLSEYEMYMSSKEKFLFELYKGLYLGEDAEFIPNDNMQLYILKAKGNTLCKRGSYLEAYDLLQKAYQLASSIADLVAMGDILLSLGYVSSFIDLVAMEKYYCTAIKINDSTNTKALAYYNMGSEFLIKNGLDKSIYYLRKGSEVCQNKALLNKFQEKIFIYYAMMQEVDQKHYYFDKLEHSIHYDLYSIMNSCVDYDHEDTYIKLVKSKKDDSILLQYLYIVNCIQNRRYKEFYLTSDFANKKG